MLKDGSKFFRHLNLPHSSTATHIQSSQLTVRMQNLTPPGSTYVSPKRKRSISAIDTSPSVARLRTTNSLDQTTFENDFASEGSPRTAVAGHLQNLNLDRQHQPIKLGLSRAFGEDMVSNSGNDIDKETEDHSLVHSQNSDNTPISTAGAPFDKQPTNLKTFPIEIPETPRMQPTIPTSTGPPPSRTSNKSPIPSSSTLWWTDTEITGHNPTDPTDDGYGINGVGFIPTPAIANARAERRKRQVAEWKNREAKEARQKRSDRRRRQEAEAENLAAVAEGMGAEEGRKVRFLEV